LHEEEPYDGSLAPGKLGKIFFPKDWSGGKIDYEVGDILTAPDTSWQEIYEERSARPVGGL